MSTAIGEALSIGLETLQIFLNSPVFYFNGTRYPCVPSTSGSATEPDEGGGKPLYDLLLIVPSGSFRRRVTIDSDSITIDDDTLTIDTEDIGSTDLDLPPVPGDPITFSGINYRVEETYYPPSESHFELRCSALHHRR